MNSYELFRIFFDWCFENPEKVSPNHIAVYSFAIEHCNRLGWKEKFGFPTEMAKDAIGIKSYKTYINTLNDLVEWGFIKMVERSKNQYSANIIALVKNTKALTKALAKASQKHTLKQDQSTGESISTIDKPGTIEPVNLEPIVADLDPLPRILSEYELCVSVWCKEIHADFIFGATQGKQMKSIIEKIKKSLKSKDREISPQSVSEFFRAMCQNLPEYFRDKDLQIIDSKYNEVLKQIKNKQQNNNNGKSSIAGTISVANQWLIDKHGPDILDKVGQG